MICVGRLRDRYYADAASEYLKRLSGYCNVETVEIPEHRLPDAPSALMITRALAKEYNAIEEKIPAGAFCAALCVEGEEFDSPKLSEVLAKCALNGISKLCFVIGGSYGLHEELKRKANIRISMSKMTFPHTLARVILLEQLYRSFSIIGGGKYHK